MEEILKYFPNLSEKQIFQFSKLGELYSEWNDKVNIISRKDINNLYVRHVLHSLSVAKFIQFKDQSKVLDVGTGGGFPGLPLAILFPKVNFLLVDSIQKKIKVVKSVSNQIGLQNLIADHERAERVEGSFDFIISRAVAEMKILISWVNNNLSDVHINSIKNGILCLKGGDLSNELSGIKNLQEIILTDYFEEEFFRQKKLVYISK